VQVSKVRLRSLQRKEIQSKQRDHQRPDKRLSCIKRADQLLMLYQTGCQLDQFRLPADVQSTVRPEWKRAAASPTEYSPKSQECFHRSPFNGLSPTASCGGRLSLISMNTFSSGGA